MRNIKWVSRFLWCCLWDICLFAGRKLNLRNNSMMWSLDDKIERLNGELNG
jgi:hypothetical protein